MFVQMTGSTGSPSWYALKCAIFYFRSPKKRPPYLELSFCLKSNEKIEKFTNSQKCRSLTWNKVPPAEIVMLFQMTCQLLPAYQERCLSWSTSVQLFTICNSLWIHQLEIIVYPENSYMNFNENWLSDTHWASLCFQILPDLFGLRLKKI